MGAASKRSVRSAALLGLVLATMVGACGASRSTSSSAQPGSTTKEVSPAGDIPDNQVYVPFMPADGLFSVKVPEGWARSESGALTTFTDKLNSVRIEVRPAGTPPTAASVTNIDVPAIRAADAHLVVKGVSEVTRPAGAAVVVKYQVDATPDPVTGKSTRLDVERYQFWRAAHEVVITLAGPVGSDNVDPWKTVTESFTWAR